MNKKILSIVTASLLLGSMAYAKGNGKGKGRYAGQFQISQTQQFNFSNKRVYIYKPNWAYIPQEIAIIVNGWGSWTNNGNGGNSGNGNGGNSGNGNGGNCGNGNSGNGNGGNCGNGGSTGATTSLPAHVQDAIDAPTSNISQELANALAFMGNEERLAYDVYNELYRQYGIKQFTNIATKSEYKHVTAVQDLVKKYKLSDNVNFTNVDLPALGYMNTPIEDMEAGTYDIAKIQKLYDDLVSQGSTSATEALKVGCIVEVVDVEDLDREIALATKENATDIVTVFNFLRDGSYNHYWAFDKGLKNRGITEGCCTWKGEDGSLNLCHPEYPQKAKGGNGGKGNGGKGNGGNGRR